MRRRVLLGLASLIAIGVVLLLALTQSGSSRSERPAPTATPTPACLPNCPASTAGAEIFRTSPNAYVPDKVTDLSPGLTLYFKPAIFVEHADGTLEAFYMAPEMGEEFVQGLPAGDKIVLVFPPEYMVGHEPPTDPPPLCMPNCPTATPGGEIASAPTNALTPQKVTDLSPGLALSYKITIYVRHDDGSLEEFFLAPEIAEKFIQDLAVGDEIVFVESPQSSLGHQAPTSQP